MTSMSCCWRPTETSRSARPARNPDACGPADRLAAAERDEVGAGVDEPAQVGARRQVHRGVDEDRQVVRVGRRHELVDRQAVRLGLALEERAGRRRADRRPPSRPPSPPFASPNSTSRAPDARTRWSYGVAVGAPGRRSRDGPSPVSGRRSIRSGSSRASIAAAPSVSAGGRAGRDVAGLGPGQRRRSARWRPPAGRRSGRRTRPPPPSQRRPRAPSASRPRASRCRAR